MFAENKLQRVLDNVIGTIELEADIIDKNGNIVASNKKENIGGKLKIDMDKLDLECKPAKLLHLDNRTISKFSINKSHVYYLSMEGVDEVSDNYSRLIASLMKVHLKLLYQKSEKNNLKRRILTNKLTELDIQVLLEDYKIEFNVPRCVYVVKTKGIEAENVKLILNKAFPRSQGDIVILMDGMTVALVKLLTEELENEDLIQLANAIEESIMNEASIKTQVGIGSIKNSMNDIYRSYEEALNAIEVGKLYNKNESVFLYDALLIERFLSEVPLELCEIYGKNLFTEDVKKVLSKEMVNTIDKFFENSLNLSETARQLFVHRNTLVYRLDKIKKATGLDLRNLHDAVTFKIIKMLMERYLREC